MAWKTITSKHSDSCHIHGSSKAANTTLIVMILASLVLIAWHVWCYGPSRQFAQLGQQSGSYPFLFGSELWDLIFSKHGILAEIGDILPYFLAGILIAGYLRTFKIAIKLRSKLRKHGVLSVILASLLGLMTPLCACGTLTTAVSLLFARMPLAPVVALMVTSPLLSPSTYLLTLNDLGPEWTVVRTVAAFSMGVFAGLLTHALRNRGFNTDSIFIEGAIHKGDFHDENYPDERLRCNCKERFGNRVGVRTNNRFLIFLAKSSEMIWTVGKYVLVGVSIGTVVERYVPNSWIYRFFGQNDPLNIIWITLGSVPVFLHQISASSIVYHIKSSLNGTVNGGAALAFMIGGPVTAMPTMVLFWTIFKKRVFFLYLFICITGSIMIAYAFQAFLFVPGVDTGNPLLKGVRSLSGGDSVFLRKLNKNVRIVMDPDGKNIIATYSNDVEGHGGVVFDGGPVRFMGRASERYDNRRYLENLAGWMELNNHSPSKNNILIYEDLFNSGLDRSALDGSLLPKGFKVRITGRREIPKLSSELLADYSQIWLIFGESEAGSQISDVELETISRFVEEGGSMLIATGNPRQGRDATSTENRLSSRYGVLFSGCVKNAEELHTSIASQTLYRISALLGKILKLVHKA